MTRYFLHLENSSGVLVDEEGADFDSLAAARRSAIQSAREIMCDRVMRGENPDGSRFLIVDTTGRTIMIVPFEEATS